MCEDYDTRKKIFFFDLSVAWKGLSIERQDSLSQTLELMSKIIDYVVCELD